MLFDVYGTILTARKGEVGTHAPSPDRAATSALRAVGFHPRRSGAGERATALLAAAIAADHKRKRNAGTKYPEVEIRRIWTRVLTRLTKEGYFSKPMNAAIIEQLCVEHECRTNPVWPMPGLHGVLKMLANAKLKIGLVSNAQFYTPLILAALPGTGWNKAWFDHDLCAWSYQLAEAKPSNKLIQLSLHALRMRHGVSPEQTAMVGNDVLNDLLPAAQFGCKTMLFAGDAGALRLRENIPACSRFIPDVVLTGLNQIPGILNPSFTNPAPQRP